jgi:hypothetical protein
MIYIHKNLWVIVNQSYKVDDCESKLAYMTHSEYGVDNEPSKAFSSRMSTGTIWAGKHSAVSEFENNPISGFTIVGSQSRWSTQNKVIRVEDPRGFVVEVPTENLTTLLKHCRVNLGTVVEECVWGREGSNHILLPTNSEVYKEALSKTKQHTNRVSFAKLSVGDLIKFNPDDKGEFIYLGKVKAEWKVYENTCIEKSSMVTSRMTWKQSTNDPKEYLFTKTDSKWCFLFKLNSEKVNSWTRLYEYKLSGKAILVGSSKDTSYKVKDICIYLPDRITNIEDGYESDYRHTGKYVTYELSNIIFKD